MQLARKAVCGGASDGCCLIWEGAWVSLEVQQGLEKVYRGHRSLGRHGTSATMLRKGAGRMCGGPGRSSASGCFWVGEGTQGAWMASEVQCEGLQDEVEEKEGVSTI